MLLAAAHAHAQKWDSLNDAGMERYRKGQYTEAEQLFLSATSVPGITTGQYTTSLTNAAYAQQMLADFSHAAENFRAILRVLEAVHREPHLDKVEAAINFANVFLPAGQYDSCELALAHASSLVDLAVRESSEHYRANVDRFFAASISIRNSLASLYQKKGLTNEAIDLMQRQRADIRAVYPEEYFSLSMYQNTISNLASYYMEVGQVVEAQSAIREQVSLSLRKPHRQIDYLHALNNLAGLHHLSEQDDSAAYYWIKAIEVFDAGLFTGSELHISVLNNMGEMEHSREHYDVALRYLQRSIDLQRNRAAVNPRLYQTTLLNYCETLFWMGSLKEAAIHYKSLSEMLVSDVIHNFTYLSDKERISFYRSNLSVLEYYKYFAFDVAGAFLHNSKGDRYISPHTLGDLFDVLLATKGLILHPGYRLRSRIMQSRDSVMRATYSQWESNKNAYATLARSEAPDLSHLSTLLHETEQLEKWLRIHSSEFRRGFVMESRSWRDIQKRLVPGEAAVEMVRLADGLIYGALILTPETPDGPVFSLIKSTRTRHLEHQFYKQYANSVAFNLTDSVSYGVYWKPVMEVVKQHSSIRLPVNRVYFSPDGIYNRINLNTLWNPDTERYYVDELDIVQVTNLKEILNIEKSAEGSVQECVLLGRPRYYSSADDGHREISDLVGTAREVDQIGQLLKTRRWRTTLLKDDAAQEATIKQLSNPYLLHLATHGFSSSQTGDNTSYVDNLLHAGVMLAGAGDRFAMDNEDGVLTAFEMTNLELDSTRLVVLSACETGLGEFHTGEGIYGLQAALRSAGARAVVISLWKVDDHATQELMTRFYQNWITSSSDIRDAFRQAQRDLRRTHPSPYHWGAFVFSGM